ncbi:Tad domain-containing protein [Candidatus Sumerlaeota bacterium]|nr:Tad domain-containing protein [Candidatus Sumerlaeota bacterium]
MNIFKKLYRDEAGQALPFFTVFSLVMAMCLLVNYNVGKTVSEKMRTQNVADAAAFSASIWQARFLNYCAYTRRAIVANYCNIASMNVMRSNKRMFKRYADETVFASDEDDGKEKEDNGQVVPMAKFINAAMLLPSYILFTQDMRMTAEQMNRLMSNSQFILYLSVVDPESIMSKIVSEAGANNDDFVMYKPSDAPSISEIDRFNVIAGFPIGDLIGTNPISALIQPNMELSDLVERDGRTIPVDEIRWQFDPYTLPLFFQGVGFEFLPGRKWSAYGYSCCADEPFWMEGTIKWAKPQLPSQPFKDKDFLLRPYADIMQSQDDTTEEGGYNGMYIVSHEGKGKHEADQDDKKLLGGHVFYVKKCDKEYCFPEVFYDFYSGGSTEPYRLIYNINQIEVFEVRRNVERKKMEPSVYCQVRRTSEKAPYLDLLGLGNPHDVLAVARAKVNFVSPDEDLTVPRVSTPNLNYPFWTAALAPFDRGRNAREPMPLGGSYIKSRFIIPDKQHFVYPDPTSSGWAHTARYLSY